uniref:piggyBac transposable element-derived protein 3-like n=1 Tax=Styela clava TaxID=7725 RepID=UPI00193983F9|nr:piggyBac transposable element-derived protein 3-like [Styela clava]
MSPPSGESSGSVEIAMAEACSTSVRQEILNAEEVLDRLDESDIDLSGSEDDMEEEYDSNSYSINNRLVVSTSNEDVEESEEPADAVNSSKQQEKKFKIKWHSPDRNPFQPRFLTWQERPIAADPLDTPAKYFFNYFQPELFQLFADQTNIYHLQAKGRILGTNSVEICRFFGASIVMANLGFPRLRMYWQKVNRVDKIAESMPVNRYFLLRNSLHVNAARQPPTGENCKPNPVGLKNFVICGKSGRAVDFEIYQGAGTGIPDETKHLGLGASVVLRLVDTIPKQKNYKICFDNYFTGIPLIRELKSRGIHSLGVVKSNRLMGCELKSEKDLKKKGRGAIDYKVSDKGDICVVRWMDNGAVTLASSFAGVDEKDQVRRWRASTKEHIMVERPKCVQVYNDNMGGVDKLDFLISLYRTKA